MVVVGEYYGFSGGGGGFLFRASAFFLSFFLSFFQQNALLQFQSDVKNEVKGGVWRSSCSSRRASVVYRRSIGLLLLLDITA